MRRQSILVLVILSMVLVEVQHVNGDLFIDNMPRTGSIGHVGELPSFLDGVSSYYAQSFRTPIVEPVFAEELTFSMDNSSGSIMNFRILLTETAGGTELDNPRDIRLTNVMYESPTVTLATTGWSQLTVFLGMTTFYNGPTYAWVIDTFSDRNELYGIASVGTTNNYPDGHFFEMATLAGTRADHFMYEWGIS